MVCACHIIGKNRISYPCHPWPKFYAETIRRTINAAVDLLSCSYVSNCCRFQCTHNLPTQRSSRACVTAWLDQHEADALPPSLAFLHNQKRSTWASRVEDCFAPLTTARPGRRSLTAKFRWAQPDASPLRIPIQTSFISALAQTACAAMSPPDAACTSRPTADRRGSLWVFTTPDRSARVRIHPTNPDIVWVAAGGDIFKSNDERGIFKTTDGGQTWRKVLFVSESVGAMDVELQPGNPNVVYAWMSRLERKPWTIISGSREGGFYKSTDGGEKFFEDHNGLPN